MGRGADGEKTDAANGTVVRAGSSGLAGAVAGAASCSGRRHRAAVRRGRCAALRLRPSKLARPSRHADAIVARLFRPTTAGRAPRPGRYIDRVSAAPGQPRDRMRGSGGGQCADAAARPSISSPGTGRRARQRTTPPPVRRHPQFLPAWPRTIQGIRRSLLRGNGLRRRTDRLSRRGPRSPDSNAWTRASRPHTQVRPTARCSPEEAARAARMEAARVMSDCRHRWRHRRPRSCGRRALPVGAAGPRDDRSRGGDLADASIFSGGVGTTARLAAGRAEKATEIDSPAEPVGAVLAPADDSST